MTIEAFALVLVATCLVGSLALMALCAVPLEAYSKSWRGVRRVRAGDFLASAARGRISDQLRAAITDSRNELWDVSPSLPHIIILKGSPRRVAAARLLYRVVQSKD